MRCPVIDVGMAMQNMVLTVRVSGERRLRFRLWCATQIMRLAARVGCFTFKRLEFKEGDG